MLNQVILIGRLVKKPELRESENGKNYLKATLAVQSDFRKKDGEYFLYSYLKELGWIGDSTVSLGISPLTDEKAKKFAEGYLSVQRYEAIFGAVQE